MAPLRNILVTGSSGFIGQNLLIALRRRPETTVIPFDVDSPPAALEEGLQKAEAVIHLAGVNRPPTEAEFETGNTGLTIKLCNTLRALGRTPLIVMSSSTQATLDNPYGLSKRRAEEALRSFAAETGAPICLYRLPGVFGKWGRPEYNSVVATFCHNAAHDLPLRISDPERELTLVYIDDVVESILSLMDGRKPNGERDFYSVYPEYQIRLGELAETILCFKESRRSGLLGNFADRFRRCLYATYLSYLPAENFDYPLERHEDHRGVLAEFLKSPHSGQLFISRTRPGITRGNHYHDSKVEKFLVIEGQAIIRFRCIRGGDVLEYRISGDDLRVVDIPPGYAHSLENIGNADLVVVFWAGEIFDPARPETFIAGV